jgi:acetylornithine deacetylase/succinyl-diaminopimelate desuccinylase-like protein
VSREAAISAVEEYFDSGRFREELQRRIAIETESQNPERDSRLSAYLDEEMIPSLKSLGFTCTVLTHPKAKGPFLFAERFEDAALPTVLGYGHGDVVRGQEGEWLDGMNPWEITEREGLWYGRGIVDNKGQHTINIAAMAAVIQARGRLGFNAKYLIEMGEEVGSPGLREVCVDNKERLSADLLLASDGPRLNALRPTLFLGARGGVNFDMWVDARAGGHHSGNWGGLISNPAVHLAHAIASVIGPTGQIRIPEWVPSELPAAVREALVGCEVDGGPDAPDIEPGWGEPGLTPAEKVFGWSSWEVLAFEAGNPKAPVNAIPPRARARCQLRFVVGVDAEEVVPALRRHLDRQGLSMVQVALAKETETFYATRLDPSDPWVRWAADSVTRTTGKKPAVLPNLGGSLPNDVFADLIGMPTVWVPHSYPGCSQHAPNEHLPPAIAREGLAMMAGLYWDLGEIGTARKPSAA